MLKYSHLPHFYSIWTPFWLILFHSAASGRRLNFGGSMLQVPSLLKTCSVEANTRSNPMQGKTSLNVFRSLILFSWIAFSLVQSNQERIQQRERNSSVMCAEVAMVAGSWSLVGLGTAALLLGWGCSSILPTQDPDFLTYMCSLLASSGFSSHMYSKSRFWQLPLSYL